MNKVDGFSDKVGIIWEAADLLRGDFRQHEYGQVILPFTVLRRLDCVLAPTRQAVLSKSRSLDGNISNVDPILERVSGVPFYNTSELTFSDLLNDPVNLAANLRSYIAGFSRSAADILDKYSFEDKIARLDKAKLLYQMVGLFADMDLAPETVPSHAMGYIFEELLRKFSEMSNETAGEHFTPREVIKLMVDVLFTDDTEALTGTAPVRTMYDPACGTGGMLSGAQSYLADLNPNAHLEVYGQELNSETWAICRSDMLIKGEDPNNIVLGNSLTQDGHHDRKFDYMLANPPFGVDWKKYAAPIVAEHTDLGEDGRFGAGLPRSSDGSLLFLQQMISKMRPVDDDPSTPTIIEGGSRLAIVFSGSPLFAGAAGGGESEIRRWIIEQDLLEGIIALPDQLFYNTGISTYFWVLTNRKRPDRVGKVALIDARDEFAKMRKSLGNKRKFIPDEAIAEITRLYNDATRGISDERVKVFNNADFGYQRITVERPLRRRWNLTDEAITTIVAGKQFIALAAPPKRAAGSAAVVAAGEQVQRELVAVLDGLRGMPQDLEDAFDKLLGEALGRARLAISSTLRKTILGAAAHADADAPVVCDRHGEPLPDPDLRDNENVPLTEDIDAYMAREVLPHVPDAWVDHTKTKIGFEIPFTRHFYQYVAPRTVADIDADIDAVEAEIQQVLRGIAR